MGWLEGLDRVAARVCVEHAPRDELLGKVRGRLVVDDRERAQVLMPYREHPAVVVAALGLDGGHVTGERADLLLGKLVHPLKVDHELGSRRDRGGCRVAGQQLGDWNTVELSQLGELL